MGIPYKSFCWSLGTTSFRTKNFNKTIETQLALLNEFWSDSENSKAAWSGNDELQTRYYHFMQEKEFVAGDAKNKPKDAREKTSGLVDIGLIDDDRKLTAVGKNLLKISSENDFTPDNPFMIAKDSFIYLKQLLKTTYEIDGRTIRPFVALLYLLSEFDHLTMEEFTYLLPLCIGEKETKEIAAQMKELRSQKTTVDHIIIKRLLSMDNYSCALECLKQEPVTEDMICEIGLNRKSRQYDKPYFELYQVLQSVFAKGCQGDIYKLYAATKKINIGKWWRSYLFDTSSEKAIEKAPLEHLKPTVFSQIKDDEDFKTKFFKVMHLFKAKATLSDYLDLNRRYVKTTDIVLFEDNEVKLDIVPRHFFKTIHMQLGNMMFTDTNQLQEDCTLKEISDCLEIDDKTLIQGMSQELGIEITSVHEAKSALEDIRYKKFNHLIDTRFTDENLLKLLELIEKRNDSEIRDMVTDNADIPTIFEYLLGIIWYKVSERKGRILHYMKLSYDADLLPKTHAAGGEADIVYEYEAEAAYPAHAVLLEATLADSTNQRRMEMEPVSRHMGRHLLRTGNLRSYCIFATNYLDINVLSDFRSRKTTWFYDTKDHEKYVEGMKIIPLETAQLKTILCKGKKYKELYALFEAAYLSALPPHKWQKACIIDKL